MSATINGNNEPSKTSFKALVDRFRANPKYILIVTAAAAISLIVAMMFWAQTPDYRVLYSNISDQDGGAVVAQLAQMQVPYRFSEHGGAIMVPAEKVYEARLKLAQLGLPKGGAVGFELLDQEKFGISQFSEQVNFQRALEGELSRTIETLGPVSSARVHLAMPKPSMFVREQKQPTASITVNLTSGRTLDAGQVSAMSYLVSSAVPGLNADDVTIVDQAGHLLTQKGAQTLQTSQLKYVSGIEADYQQRIQAILAPIVGASNVRAQVTAQVDFTTHEQTAEQFQPNTAADKMAIRSRQTNDSRQGGRSAPGGVPGALSNQPPMPTSAQIAPVGQAGQPAAGKTAAGASASEMPFNTQNDETTNYELDRTLTHIKRSTGNVERLSVAVVVNYLPGEKDKPVALSKAQMEQIDKLVREAMGFSQQRGDTLNIVNSPFMTEVAEAAPPLWKQDGFINLLLTGLRYLFIAIIVWILWRKAIQPAWLRHQELAVQQLELEKLARQAEHDKRLMEDEERNQEAAQARIETDLNTQHLRDIAEQEPQVIALVLRQWINKEKK